jgi:DNA-binding Xre family transcriptional regulator
MGRYRKHLASELKLRRGERSMREFAIKVGLSKTTIQRIENEDQNVTIDTIEHLCNKLRCEVNELLGSRQ